MKNTGLPTNVHELPELHNRAGVFRDRAHAGEILAGMLDDFTGSDVLVLAIPAGGVPVAVVIAKQLHLPFDVAVVSKITLPWNTEAGYGAVAFDGTVQLNEWLLPRLGLTDQEIQEGIARTLAKVTRRVQRLRGKRPFPALAQGSVIVVDDGLASGFTLQTACAALTRAGAKRLIAAVPTGHWEAVQRLAAVVDTLYCANIRQGWSFAVADAYQRWCDVSEEEVMKMLQGLVDSPRP
jgi:predicted phosphoribosyltransferase